MDSFDLMEESSHNGTLAFTNTSDHLNETENLSDCSCDNKQSDFTKGMLIGMAISSAVCIGIMLFLMHGTAFCLPSEVGVEKL